MIKSELCRGLIYAGDTQLASDLVIEKTGPLQLTVRAGSLTTTGDRAAGVPSRTYTLAADSVLDLVPMDVDRQVLVTLESSESGVAPCLTIHGSDGTVVRTLDFFPAWAEIMRIVLPFCVPAGCTDLSEVDIYVLEVRPGFPEGYVAGPFQAGTA